MNKYLLSLVLSLLLASCGTRSIPNALKEVDTAWMEVQNQYKNRADLTLNLVEVVKPLAPKENQTFEEILEARAAASRINVNANQLNDELMQKFQNAQTGLSVALGKLMALVGTYPDLKIGQKFSDLHLQLIETENRITAARNRYSESVQKYNNLITAPPESWYNSLFLKYQKRPQFLVNNPPAAQDAPKVQP